MPASAFFGRYARMLGIEINKEASITAVADGYFIFTTFSLWLDPAQLQGPYTLPGSRADYWAALREANGEP